MAKKSGLQYSPARAIAHLKNADVQMAELISLVGPFKLQDEFSISPFQSLVRAIVFQQLAGSAASAIYSRVQQLFPDPGNITPGQLVQIEPDTLRGAGLSRSKTTAVLDLSQKCIDGVVPDLAAMHKLDDGELVKRLCAVRGVGRWTAEIMMIYRLGRADVLPVTDLGIRKGYQLAWQLQELPDARQLLQDLAHLSPYRSVASWYLWRATDSVDWSAHDR